MERSDWNVPEMGILYISNDVYNIINNNKPISCEINRKNDWVIIKNPGYAFNFIKISENNKTKLSAFSWNYIAKIAWEHIENKTIDGLNEIFNALLDSPGYTKFNSEHRSTSGTFIKVGGLLAKLFPELNGDELSVLAGRVTEDIRKATEQDISIVEVSDKPSEVYTLKSSFTSCMRNQNPDRFKIYDDLENTEIAYIKGTDGELLARALIHRNVKTHDGKIISIMDRVYSVSNTYTAILSNYAHKNGLYTKKYLEGSGCNEYIDPETGKCSFYYLEMNTHDLISKRYIEVPYIDTFRYLINSTKLTSDSDKKHTTRFDSTCGYDSERVVVREMRTCKYCGSRSEDTIRIGYSHYCPTCVESHFHMCAICNRYIHNDVGEICRDCLDNTFMCPECNQYKLYSTMTFNETLEEPICSTCMEQRNPGLIRCDICGNHVSTTISSDGMEQVVCQECFEIGLVDHETFLGFHNTLNFRFGDQNILFFH